MKNYKKFALLFSMLLFVFIFIGVLPGNAAAQHQGNDESKDARDEKKQLKVNSRNASSKILHIPSDKIKRAYPEQRKMKIPQKTASAKKTGNSKTPKSRSTSMINTYYIWSFDGKLMAEYDNQGNCTREYIYLGNRLIAEYHPQTDKYYYHFQDQINSTRIVTDGEGNVVYSAAYGPYGDIQKVWVNTYDPKLKFSGKERESYSGLDYFGARYYDNHSYRFLSVDPVRNRKEAITNPQLWNMYSYCGNNPITYLDPDGSDHSSSRLKSLFGKEKFDEVFNQAKINALRFAIETAASFMMHGTLEKVPTPIKSPKSGKVVTTLGKLAKKLRLNIKSSTTQNIINNRNLTVKEFISKFRKGSIQNKFPGEFLDKTVEDALKSGNTTVRKLLTDKRFLK